MPSNDQQTYRALQARLRAVLAQYRSLTCKPGSRPEELWKDSAALHEAVAQLSHFQMMSLAKPYRAVPKFGALPVAETVAALVAAGKWKWALVSDAEAKANVRSDSAAPRAAEPLKQIQNVRRGRRVAGWRSGLYEESRPAAEARERSSDTGSP
jgi:hypothetical protein